MVLDRINWYQIHVSDGNGTEWYWEERVNVIAQKARLRREEVNVMTVFPHAWSDELGYNEYGRYEYPY